MLYALHELGYQAAMPSRLAAAAARDWLNWPGNPIGQTDWGRQAAAGAELFGDVTRRYTKPKWGIDTVPVNGHDVRVRPVTVWSSPWCRLVHFARDRSDLRRAGLREFQPAVLLVAPLSGHYATLLRGTVEAFLQDHESMSPTG
jgi:poly(3-hydroxybutyrate) depolymerase